MSTMQRRAAGASYYSNTGASGSRRAAGSSRDGGRAYRNGSGRPGPASPRIAQPPLVSQTFIDALERLPPPQQWPSRVVSYAIVDPLLALFRFVLEVVVSPRTHRVVLRLGVLASLVWVALGLAIAGYVGFYRAWVPQIGVTRDVWLQYGESTPPFAEIDLHTFDGLSGIFAQDQEYDVSLDLVVPLSAANLDLGNFMVALELTSAHNRTIHRVSKPCIIVHEPAPIRAMNNLMFQLTRNAPTFILPTSSPPVQLLTISLLYRAILEPAQSAHPFAGTVTAGVTRARVSVGRHDADKYWVYGGGHGVGGVLHESGGILKAAAGYDGFRSRGELQTHSASLRFDAHLTGLRYFMYHYPVASFILFTSLFMAFELLSALTLWAVAAFYTSNITQPSLAVEDNYTGSGRFRSASMTDTDGAIAFSGDDDDYETETQTAESDKEQVDEQKRQSLSSLQALDARELYEQRRAELLRDELEGRRMTAVDQAPTGALGDLVELTQGRRVLGRLDEETEEDTDVHASETSAGWEDVGEEDGGGVGAGVQYGVEGETQDENEGEGQLPAGLRRRQVKEEEDIRESTIGGSSTSRASSVRSFGATSVGTSLPSRGQTEATPEIKEEEEEEEEGDDTEREAQT